VTDNRGLLSVCCVVSGPLSRVAVLLDQVSAIADEIVCVVDSRVPIEELALLDARADVVVRGDVDPQSGIERNLAWLHSLCSGKWILRLDADELLSSDLINEIPSLLRAEDVAQYQIRRLWSFPDVNQVLAEPPWSNDWQTRLVRNEKFLLRFPGFLHTSVETISPYRYAYAPMYHLDCLLHTLDERSAKADRYLRIRSDVGSTGGRPLNDFYLPEKYPSTSSRPVPFVDAVRLRESMLAGGAVIVGASPSARRWQYANGEVPVVGFEEIDRHWSLRTPRETAYRCKLEIINSVTHFHANERRVIEIRAENLGTERWPYGDQHPLIRLGHRWLDVDSEQTVMEGERSAFTADVIPGSTSVQRMVVQAPPNPGDYLLELNVLHEHVRWFDGGTITRVAVGPDPYDGVEYGEDFYDSSLQGMVESARHVLREVLPLVQPSSAVDVGCGEGAWLRVCTELGIDDVLGLDGPWVRPERLQIRATDFLSTDLSIPIQLDRTFDLAICLEVAEHLVAEHADTLVDSICTLAPAVLFSAAVPGQGGVHHVNEQWPDYWLSKFEARGYDCFDVVRPMIWSNALVEWWYCQNVFLLLKRDHPSHQEMAKRNEQFAWPRSLIHPRAWVTRS